MKKLIVLLLSLLLVSCSALGERITNRLSVDLTRTAEIATKANEPGIAKCAIYFNEALSDSTGALSEPTEGLISLAIKAYLLRKRNPEREAAFKRECGEFATGVLIELGRAAISAAPGPGGLLK